MVDKCANAKCSQELKYLRDGKIFVFEVGDARSVYGSAPTRRLEHFWLCAPCATRFTLKLTARGIRLMPRSSAERASRSALEDCG